MRIRHLGPKGKSSKSSKSSKKKGKSSKSSKNKTKTSVAPSISMGPSQAPSAEPSSLLEANLGFEKGLQGWTIESAPGEEAGIYGTRCDDAVGGVGCYAYVAASNRITGSFNIEPNGDVNCISFYYRFNFEDYYYLDSMTVTVSGHNGVIMFTETVTGDYYEDTGTAWTLVSLEFSVVPNAPMTVNFEGLSQNTSQDHYNLYYNSELHLDGFSFIDGPCLA